jgi:NAD(P)-dependent dehydrogenase (short-subunit alcohol dehydrogenase family)
MASHTPKAMTIKVDPAHTVSGLWLRPRSARACLLLAHGAGAGMHHPFMIAMANEFSTLFDMIIAVNLRAIFRLTALFGTQMREGNGGAIVNISSSGSLKPDPSFAPYGAAKSGLNVLTATFAQEFGPKVRVNTVMPGPFHTDGTSAWSRSDAFEQHARRTLPLQRGGDPPEITGAVLFLVSDLASFTTGACLTVDGGHSIGNRTMADRYNEPAKL